MSELSPPIRAAVLTISDRCARGVATDTSGPALQRMLREKLDAEIAGTALVPDEADRIAGAFREWSSPHQGIDLALSTGGTGLAPRDVTPEAALRIIERQHAGLMELVRARCAAITPLTYLSRGVAGTAGRTLIITLPGSERGATECLAALLDILPHAIGTLRGLPMDDARNRRNPG